MEDIRRIEEDTKRELDQVYTCLYHFCSIVLYAFASCFFSYQQQRASGEVRGMSEKWEISIAIDKRFVVYAANWTLPIIIIN